MPPQDPPEGCFWKTVGRALDPALVERIRVGGSEPLCRSLLNSGLNEQSR